MAIVRRMGISEEKLKRLAEAYRRGIAEVLGVPTEYIRDDVVMRYVENWAKAFLKSGVLFDNSEEHAKMAGREMGYLFKDIGRNNPELFRS